jgi:molecular chaperone GrpE (heat shock protein)
MQLESHVDELQGILKEEKEHFATLKAHNEEERKKAVKDAVARVRSDVLMRLENIRLFADRKEPNRQGILNLVREIQDALQAIGEKS